ncbi:MAG: glucose-1-phosphatase [Bacteroidales bacterium]|nr:glucose-1-phosphatase [Bacteroidales bacterium]
MPEHKALKGKYRMEQILVLSRHNLRSPLSGRGSVTARITPHEWFHWTSGPSELSRKGAVLETMMGQFFCTWLSGEDFIDKNWRPSEGEVRIYANSRQRTLATAKYFSAGMFPVAALPVESHCAFGEMDPVFHPQITTEDEAFLSRARHEIDSVAGAKGLAYAAESLSDNLSLLAKVLDIRKSPAAQNDTLGFRTDDAAVTLGYYEEPAMTGGLKMAATAVDALSLQYYEDAASGRRLFGHRVSREEVGRIDAIKDLYHRILFGAPCVAAHTARPLLKEMLSELRTPGRRFTFLCGHDSNILTVLTSMDACPYSAPNTIEKLTPIGGKLVIIKWKDASGEEFADLHLVYAGDLQVRYSEPLDMDNPPQSLKLYLEGLDTNEDGLYRLADLEARFERAIR